MEIHIQFTSPVDDLKKNKTFTLIAIYIIPVQRHKHLTQKTWILQFWGGFHVHHLYIVCIHFFWYYCGSIEDYILFNNMVHKKSYPRHVKAVQVSRRHPVPRTLTDSCRTSVVGQVRIIGNRQSKRATVSHVYVNILLSTSSHRRELSILCWLNCYVWILNKRLPYLTRWIKIHFHWISKNVLS